MAQDFPQKNHALKYFSIESIFHWKPTIKRENLHEYEYEPQKDNEFNFFNFAIRLVKCYHIHEEDLNSALDIITDLETDALTWNKNQKENLFAKIKEAYIHLIFASKMFLLQKNSQLVAKIMDKITPIDDMNDSNKAAIYAARSAVLILCSNEGIEKAIGYIDKALNLDPDNAQWISLKALHLRKLRESINRIEPPSMMEKELFEAAYKKEPTNVVYKLQVADMYVELSEHILKQTSDCDETMIWRRPQSSARLDEDYVFPNNISLNDHTRFEADSKIGKAVEYYEHASKKYPESSYVLFCCARGFIRLPPRHKDIELARTLLNEGLKRNPKSITGHLTMAHLLEEYDENLKKAKWHLEICQKLKSFDADLAMIRIMHIAEDSAAYGFKSLQALAEKYTEKLQLAVIHSQMVSFYLFVKYDLIKACHYAEKFYQLNSTSSCMRIHRSIFFNYPTPFCLIDVLMDEIKYKKRTPRSPDSIRQICEDFEIFMCYQNVPIQNGFPQNLRWKILQGKSVTYVKPPNKYPDRNSFSRGDANKKYDGDQSNGRYNGNRLRRADSMNDFRGTFENNRSLNGNYYSYQDQQRRNNNDNYRSGFPYGNNNTNHRSKLPSNGAAFSPRTTPPRESLPEPTHLTENGEKNLIKIEKLPESKPSVIEKRPKESSKTDSDESMNSDDEKLVKMILKSLKKIKAVREKKSKNSTSHHKNSSSSSESENASVSKELEYYEKSSSRKKDYYSESDSESDDDRKRDCRKEYSRKKHHTHGDSDYSFAEMKKVRGKRRDSPRAEREKLRNDYDLKENLIQKKSLKYKVKSGYSSNDEDHSYSNDRGSRKEKRSSRY